VIPTLLGDFNVGSAVGYLKKRSADRDQVDFDGECPIHLGHSRSRQTLVNWESGRQEAILRDGLRQ
jgi:hypothetical protein